MQEAKHLIRNSAHEVELHVRRRGAAPPGLRPYVPPPPSEWEAAVAGLQESVAGALGDVAEEAREQWERLLETPAAVELRERAGELEHEIKEKAQPGLQQLQQLAGRAGGSLEEQRLRLQPHADRLRDELQELGHSLQQRVEWSEWSAAAQGWQESGAELKLKVLELGDRLRTDPAPLPGAAAAAAATESSTGAESSPWTQAEAQSLRDAAAGGSVAVVGGAGGAQPVRPLCASWGDEAGGCCCGGGGGGMLGQAAPLVAPSPLLDLEPPEMRPGALLDMLQPAVVPAVHVQVPRHVAPSPLLEMRLPGAPPPPVPEVQPCWSADPLLPPPPEAAAPPRPLVMLPPPATPPPDEAVAAVASAREAAVRGLVAMGFEQDHALAALLACGMDESAALDRLLMTERVPPAVAEEEEEAERPTLS